MLSGLCIFVNKNFTIMLDRIKQLMNFYNLSSSQFADKIGVQRSAVSHVLSGRNRPSLDFVLKIKDTFPAINLDWLILGKGEMTGHGESDRQAESGIKQQELTFEENIVEKAEENDIDKSFVKNNISEPARTEELKSEPAIHYGKTLDREVEMIVHYYKDGTFKVYKPR